MGNRRPARRPRRGASGPSPSPSEPAMLTPKARPRPSASLLGARLVTGRPPSLRAVLSFDPHAPGQGLRLSPAASARAPPAGRRRWPVPRIPVAGPGRALWRIRWCSSPVNGGRSPSSFVLDRFHGTTIRRLRPADPPKGPDHARSCPATLDRVKNLADQYAMSNRGRELQGTGPRQSSPCRPKKARFRQPGPYPRRPIARSRPAKNALYPPSNACRTEGRDRREIRPATTGCANDRGPGQRRHRRQAGCFNNALMATLNPGDEVIIPPPTTWVSYPDMVLAGRRTPSIVPTRIEDGYRLTPRHWRPRSSPRTALACCFNSPLQPDRGRAIGGRRDGPDRACCAPHAGSGILTERHVMNTGLRRLCLQQPPRRRTGALTTGRWTVQNGVSKAYAMTGLARRLCRPGRGADRAGMRTLQSQSTSNPCSGQTKGASRRLDGPAGVSGRQCRPGSKRAATWLGGPAERDPRHPLPVPGGGVLTFTPTSRPWSTDQPRRPA